MKITVALPVTREGEGVEASLSLNGDGVLELSVPTVKRKAGVDVGINAEDMQQAITTLSAVASSDAERTRSAHHVGTSDPVEA